MTMTPHDPHDAALPFGPAARTDIVGGMQPFLHDLVSLVCAPALLLSRSDGAMTGHGAEGFFVNDRRVLTTMRWTIDDTHLSSISSQMLGADATRHVAVVRGAGDDGPDPTVIAVQRLQLTACALTASMTITSRARTTVSLSVHLHVGADFADIAMVKQGAPVSPVAASPTATGFRFVGRHDMTTEIVCEPPPPEHDASSGLMTWTVTLLPGESATIAMHCTPGMSGVAVAVIAPATRDVVGPLEVAARDRRIPRLVAQATADLRGLLLGDPMSPADTFLAAGSPWFLTLFGRDSLIAARMLLPVAAEVAAGTLRALARRQGTVADPLTAEAPGKILHELRADGVDHGEHASASGDRRLTLPPVYYGSVDATPLWISLLHDAWSWGMPTSQVIDLLPALRAALGWLGADALDDRGFVSYLDESGSGIVNQGWKDSADSIQFGDGRLAVAPIALCEVQGYAFAAARHGAALLDAFAGADGGDADIDRTAAAGWRRWADALGDRFRSAFWVEDRVGHYPAVALDRHGSRVDSVTSNIAHLLGTGLLDDGEEALVVARLAMPDMDCGFGLRTLSSLSGGFNPYSYHGGSVWTHDTALAIVGLLQVGSAAAASVAAALVEGLLCTAEHFDYRLPELYTVEQLDGEAAVPIIYPASCRPQAWSAASAIAVLIALIGEERRSPDGRSLRPSAITPYGEVHLRRRIIEDTP